MPTDPYDVDVPGYAPDADPVDWNGADLVDRETGLPTPAFLAWAAHRDETTARIAAHESRTALPVDHGALTDEDPSIPLRDVDVTGLAPDPYDARRHTVRTGRTRKGRATAEVTHYGRNPAPTTDRASGLAAAGAIELARFTRAHECDCSLTDGRTTCDVETHVPAMLGTEVRAFAQVTPKLSPVAPSRIRGVTAWNGAPMLTDAAYGVHTDACGVARTASDMAGWYSVPRDYLDGTRSASDAATAPWPTRTAMPTRRPRTGEAPVTVAPLVVDDDGTAFGSLAHLLAWSDDTERVWVGHQLVTRRPAMHRGRPSTTVERAEVAARAEDARRSLDVEVVETIAAAMVDGGTVDVPRGTLTVRTPDAAGQCRWTLTTTDGRTASGRSRSAAGVAHRVS
jgi:hypothetical protein